MVMNLKSHSSFTEIVQSVFVRFSSVFNARLCMHLDRFLFPIDRETPKSKESYRKLQLTQSARLEFVPLDSKKNTCAQNDPYRIP